MRLLVLVLFLVTLFPFQTFAQNLDIWENRDERLEWWRDAKFGLFIHFGLYAIPAGQWDERKSGWSEWLMNGAQIPPSEYEKLAEQFNPSEFNADEWVNIAKSAGMKYIVITTKHHEGFALFDSKVSEYDITNTPFKRDIIAELAEACQKADIKLGLYYSILDWHHPDYLPRREWDTRPADNASYERYLEYMYAQLDELLENYPGISILWFDGGWEGDWTQQRGVELHRYLVNKNPSLIVNNRVGREQWVGKSALNVGPAGDFDTPELHLPSNGVKGYDWETCMTMNDSWGYHKLDENWKSVSVMLEQLITIASTDGNFLLNVGPDASGKIPAASVDKLEKIGGWLEVNGESIYGTSGLNLGKTPWGRATQKQLENGNTRIYLHVLSWPEDGVLVVQNLKNTVTKAFLLAKEDRSVSFDRNSHGLTLHLDFPAPDSTASVIVLDVEGPVDVEQQVFVFNDSDELVLPLREGQLTGKMIERLSVTENGETWSSPDAALSWKVSFEKSATYRLYLEYKCAEWAAGEEFELLLGDNILNGKIEPADSLHQFLIGDITVEEVGIHLLEMKPGLSKPFSMVQPESVVLKKNDERMDN